MKRSSPDKGHKSSAMDAILHMESKNYHHHHHDSPLTSNGVSTAGVERFELPRIYISLSRKEKEDDFLAMKGTKLPQRPKKRAKNVDKTLQVTPLQPPGLELDLIYSYPIRSRFSSSQNLHVLPLLLLSCSLSSRGCGCQI